MKVLCPKCKGRKTVVSIGLAIFTFGLSLIDNRDQVRDTCPNCKGKGFLEF